MSDEPRHEHDIALMRIADYTPDHYVGSVVLEKTRSGLLVARPPHATPLAEPPRRYAVTVIGEPFQRGPNVTKVVEVWAYGRREAMDQVRSSLYWPTADIEWWTPPIVIQCEPARPEGTE